MNKWVHRIEIFADRSVPYALLVLFFVIVGELFFTERVEHYKIYVSIIDGIIIGIFALDLSFKYYRSKNIPDFLRSHWLDIIAVFPAFIFIRFVEELRIVSNLEETVLLSQESLEIGEKVGSKTSRIHYFARFIRPLARLPRFLKAFSFYERPHHHLKPFKVG